MGEWVGGWLGGVERIQFFLDYWSLYLQIIWITGLFYNCDVVHY